MNEIPVDKPLILLLGSKSLFFGERGSEENLILQTRAERLNNAKSIAAPTEKRG